MSRSGANLALLLLEAFRALANSATEELAKRGHEDYRAAHDFALRAIASGADSASELGRRLSVSKQAAAKTIAALQERGYIVRNAHRGDGRRKKLEVTPMGLEVMMMGEAIFNDLQQQWGKKIGPSQMENLEQSLHKLLDRTANGIIDPSWFGE